MNRKQEERKGKDSWGRGLALWERSLVPDVRVRGEDSILEGLGGHPAHGQQPLPSLPVIVGLIDVSRHPKICEEERRHESYPM